MKLSEARKLIAAALLAWITHDSQLAAAESGPLGFGSSKFTEELESDRPDFTEGTQAIQAGHFQLEGGYTYIYNESSDVTIEAQTVPELLLRTGLYEDFELRLAWAGYVSEKTEIDGESSDTVDGVSDMSVGFKHHMYDQQGTVPSASFIFQLGLPVGSEEASADEVEPELKLLWAYDLSEPIGIAGNLNFAAPQGEEERFFEVAASGTVGAALTESIGSYLEYFGFYPEDTPGETETHYLNGGFTLAVTPNFQLDVRAGFGLNDAAEDFFTGAGFAWRQ